MATALGSLAVSISAETASFEAALNRSASQARDFGKAANDNFSSVLAQVDSALERSRQTMTSFGGVVGGEMVTAFDKAKSALTGFALGTVGLGAGLGFAAVVAQVDKAIESMASLKDLSEKTGASIESLSALGATAKQAGLGLDTVETGLVRMAKAMSGADDEAKGAGHALDTLGLSAKELRTHETSEALKIVADRLAEYRDGAGKTALAMDLFGRSGAQLLPFLKELAERQDLVGKVTSDSAYLADHYEKSLQRLTAGANSFYRTIAIEVLPVLSGLIDRMNDGIKIAGGFWSALGTFGAGSLLGGAKTDVAALNKELADLIAQRNKITATNAPNPAMAEGALKYVDQQIETIKKQLAFQDALAERERPALYPANAATVAKAYAGYDTETQRQAQMALAASYFPDSSVADFDKKSLSSYVSRIPKADDGLKQVDTSRQILAGQLKAWERTIDAERDLLSQRNGMLERYYRDDLMSIGDYYGARAAVLRENMDRVADAYAKEEKILKDFMSHTADSRLQAEAQNRLAEVRDKGSRAALEGGLKLDQNAFDQARAYEQLNRQLEALDARYTAMLGHAEAAAAISFDSQNRALAMKLNAEGAAEALEKLAALRDRALEDASTSSEAGARRAFRNYIQDAQNTGKAVESALSRSFGAMEDALVSFTTTGKLSFKSFADSVVADLMRIAVRQQITAPLSAWLQGQATPGGGLVGFLGNALGSLAGGRGTANPAAMAAKTSEDYIDAGGMGQGGGLFSKLADMLPSFDVGTDYVPSDMIAKIHAGERIVPAAQNKPGFGGVTQHLTINVGGQVDSRTAQQIALQAGIAVRRALARGA